jgi:SCY1-like protein 2
MGNQLIKDYEIFKDDHFVGGAGGLWKIYSGRKLDKSAREVSIFIFDKKQVSKLKKSREDFYNFMRKESQTLARYKHPNILGLVEPLVEDKERMAFVTERVQGTLLSMINRNDNSFYSSEMEVKIHIVFLFLFNFN